MICWFVLGKKIKRSGGETVRTGGDQNSIEHKGCKDETEGWHPRKKTEGHHTSTDTTHWYGTACGNEPNEPK